MNKLFKLIYINLLSLFDVNKIIIARSEGVKSNLEKRTILIVLINIVYAYFLYFLYRLLNLEDKTMILVIGFLVSSIYCFFSNLSVVEVLLFKNDDISILSSYPIARNHILFSKLFTVYLKNLLITALFMGVSLLSYYNTGATVSETFFIMILLVSFIIPILPIIGATMISYIDDYFKITSRNSFLYKLIKTIILGVVFVILLFVFNDIKSDSLTDGVYSLINMFYYLYPLTFLLKIMLIKESLLLFIIMLFIPLLSYYLFTLIINNNYLKICSMLKGVKKESNFDYKKNIVFSKFFGLFRKEIYNLFKNKIYLTNSFSFSLMATLFLIAVCYLVDFDKYVGINNFDLYLNLYLPTILSFLGSAGCSTICSMSLEKDNMQLLRTMPFNIGEILLCKWFVNLLIGSIFVLINGTVVWMCFDIDKFTIIFNYLLPFIALMFVSFTGLILDYRFIEKNETEDSEIIKQRLVVMVPMFLSLLIGLIPFFMPMYTHYEYLLGAYAFAFLIFIVIEGLYLLIYRKKLLENLFK